MAVHKKYNRNAKTNALGRGLDALACGSASITNTLFSKVAREAAKLMVVVVFPTPPF